jgi:hypothetical protein
MSLTTNLLSPSSGGDASPRDSKEQKDPSKIRKLLLKLPERFSKYKEFAELSSKHPDDEYVLDVFHMIKKKDKSQERIVPYSWEIEYDMDVVNQ